jgi:chromosome segregation ATPase
VLTKYLTGKGRAETAGTVSSDHACRLSAAIEERDAAIARLEQTISEQKAHIETLEHALEQAKFRTKIVEQSYSTQLREAREHAAAAEQSATDQQTRIDELEADHEELKREFAGARARLESFGPDAASIDEFLESFSMPQEQTRSHDPDDVVDESVDPQMLEEMLAPDVMFAGKGK